MNYEEAVREWGARKLEAKKIKPKKGPAYYPTINRGTVQVNPYVENGYGDCPSCDPYGSFSEPATYYCEITGRDLQGGHYGEDIPDLSYMDFLRELLEVAEGTLNS